MGVLYLWHTVSFYNVSFLFGLFIGCKGSFYAHVGHVFWMLSESSELCFNLCRSHIASYDFYIGIEAKIQRRHKVPFGMENETCVIQ